ncbi:MAG: 2-dehydropantoate 2-reductase [Deltaproteobacteria bacterium]|nr:2-dehydropantoate 2-reductase [Deltaproteobacteria bacterium]
MKIAVMGVGGVGGFYGSLLARHYAENRDVQVIFIARGAHLQAIQTDGLKMQGTSGEFIVRPDLATDNPGECGPFDTILFCTKGYAIEDGARAVMPGVNTHTVVISLLNGVDNPKRLKTILHKGRILNGCVYLSAHILGSGVIEQIGGSGKMFFGDETDPKFNGRGIETVLRDAGIDAVYSRDIERIVWEKYIFICPFASATTFLNKTIRGVLEDKEGRALLDGLLDEVIHVADARGVDLPQNIREITLNTAYSFPRETKTSMHKDAEDGKETEIDTFTGTIVNAARQYGVSVPYHENVYKSLKGRLQA